MCPRFAGNPSIATNTLLCQALIIPLGSDIGTVETCQVSSAYIHNSTTYSVSY